MGASLDHVEERPRRLQDEIARTVDNSDVIEEEMRDLFKATDE